MPDDDPRPEKNYPLSTSKMSKTPSWIMLGFLLGAVFVAALPPLRKKPAPETVTLKAIEPSRPAAPREPGPLSTIEDVFAEWGKHAVWLDDVTEVAMWNISEKAYSDFYEVRRINGVYYFRTIPRLTRRVIARGKHLSESPLQFTESEEQYREWQTYGRSERPQEPVAPARPRPTSPTPGTPAPMDNSLRIVPPALPPPEFPTGRFEKKK
jgi:hypothetical protein